MAFKLTYTDGQESDYDDDTKWEVEAGVLKLGRDGGNWSVLVSPSHWATLEVGQGETKDRDDKDKKEDKKEDKDAKDEKDDKDNDDKDEDDD